MEVINISAGATSFTANAYLVPGDETVLIDVGTPASVVDTIRSHVDTVDRVLITHAHNDHVAQLSAVSEAFSPAVYMVADHPERTTLLQPGDEVRIGNESFAVVDTPGHADDHVAFLGNEALFSGDVVVYNDGAFDDGSFGRTDLPGQDREKLIDSIERLLDRTPASVDHLYAGHGDVYTGDVRAVLQRALDRAKRREPKYPEA